MSVFTDMVDLGLIKLTPAEQARLDRVRSETPAQTRARLNGKPVPKARVRRPRTTTRKA